jgi:hypothetical protein
MSDKTLEARLNDAAKALATSVAQGLPSESYGQRVCAAAERLYAVIADGLAADETIEIWAEKQNRGVLKIGRVGTLSGTRFPFERYRHVNPSSTSSTDSEECELVVITEFTVYNA